MTPSDPLHANDLISRKPEENAVSLGERWVVMSVERGAYFELNALGAHVWERIAEERSLGEVCGEIAECFGMPLEEVTKDVAAFVTQLRDQNILTVRRPQ